MNKILEGGQVPESWQKALITLIPENGSNLDEIKNYRPISLLNSDYKLFTKILARFKKILVIIINKDQSDFLLGRQIYSNIRLIVDTIGYLEMRPDKMAALILVDAEKAFNNVLWDFMKKPPLEMMSLGEKISSDIKAIYNFQKARLIINGETSEAFSISKGTGQGCPLSPLLYITVLEVYLKAIREDSRIEGIKLRQRTYKVRVLQTT